MILHPSAVPEHWAVFLIILLLLIGSIAFDEHQSDPSMCGKPEEMGFFGICWGRFPSSICGKPEGMVSSKSVWKSPGGEDFCNPFCLNHPCCWWWMWGWQCKQGSNLIQSVCKHDEREKIDLRTIFPTNLPNSKDNQDPELGNLFLCSRSRTCAESIAADDRKMLGAKFCLYSRASRDCKLYLIK